MHGKDEFSHNNPLEWWKQNQQGNFPILARLAKVYLSIPATSAPSERIFSMAARVISAQQASMKPDMAGKVLFVSDNWDQMKDRVDLLQVAKDAEKEGEEKTKE